MRRAVWAMGLIGMAARGGQAATGEAAAAGSGVRIARFSGDREAAVSFALATDLDPKLFGFPLTAVIDAPGATAAEARREGDPRPLAAAIEADRILVDVVPGPGAVTVTWRGK